MTAAQFGLRRALAFVPRIAQARYQQEQFLNDLGALNDPADKDGT